jgi:hypothetical protein
MLFLNDRMLMFMRNFTQVSAVITKVVIVVSTFIIVESKWLQNQKLCDGKKFKIFIIMKKVAVPLSIRYSLV